MLLPPASSSSRRTPPLVGEPDHRHPDAHLRHALTARTLLAGAATSTLSPAMGTPQDRRRRSTLETNTQRSPGLLTPRLSLPLVRALRLRLLADPTAFHRLDQLQRHLRAHRVLLYHDHGVNWWIPDGQLCPTIPNRSNYIHWIEDLRSSELVLPNSGPNGNVRGFDIGTGANCIYPLLGASLLGWSFVGSDVTDVALEWARKECGKQSSPLRAD